MPAWLSARFSQVTSTRRRRWTLQAGLLVVLAAVSVGLGGALAGEPAWLLCLPGSLLALLAAGVYLGLWGSRGGLPAVARGQFPPLGAPPAAGVMVEPGAEPGYTVTAWIDLQRPLAHLPPEYLSFALDTAQLVGGRWWHPLARRAEAGSGSWQTPVFDFDRPALETLARGLAPAYLRLGGSEADKVYYALDLPERQGPLAPGFASRLTAAQWLAANAYAGRCGLQIVFTLNAGPGPRRLDGGWDPAHAAALLEFSARHGLSVPVWELGNELNVNFAVHGLQHTIPAEQYAADLVSARALVRRYSPESRLACQGSAFWPILGEPLGFFFGYLPDSLKLAAKAVDIITWHYYPQQSRRAPQAVRKAHPWRLLDPATLDEVGYWAAQVSEWGRLYAPGKPVWLGETGHAQNGGEPGLSDTYLSSLWWLDQLGLMARLGQQVVVRQTLAGSDYGLIDEQTLEPRPDYWNSWLWKRLMGSKVYPAGVEGAGSARLRVYAHSTPGRDQGEFTLLALNLDSRRAVRLALPSQSGRAFRRLALSTPDIYSHRLFLNGQELKLENGCLPRLEGEPVDFNKEPAVDLPPLGIVFLQVA